MDYSKGMSQTLALIVAASVLMMTALTVIFMTQGSLTDVFSGSNRQSCLNTIKSTCQFSGPDASHNIPASCDRAGVNVEGLTQVGKVDGDSYYCASN